MGALLLRDSLTLPATTSALLGTGATGRMRQEEGLWCPVCSPGNGFSDPKRTTPSMGGAAPPHTLLLWQGSWSPFCDQRKRDRERTDYCPASLSSHHIGHHLGGDRPGKSGSDSGRLQGPESRKQTGLRDCRAPDGHHQVIRGLLPACHSLRFPPSLPATARAPVST